jgi:outer membrane protein assembly factor BamB
MDYPLSWLSDGRSFLVVRRSDMPAKIFRVDSETGKRSLWKEVTPADSAGVAGISAFVTTPDGKAYAYNFIRTLSDLFLVEGLR